MEDVGDSMQRQMQNLPIPTRRNDARAFPRRRAIVGLGDHFHAKCSIRRQDRR